jgi:hypothetical protein
VTSRKQRSRCALINNQTGPFDARGTDVVPDSDQPPGIEGRPPTDAEFEAAWFRLQEESDRLGIRVLAMASPSAARMARLRERQANGLVRVSFDVHAERVAALLRLAGLLAPQQEEDSVTLSEALRRYVTEVSET